MNKREFFTNINYAAYLKMCGFDYDVEWKEGKVWFEADVNAMEYLRSTFFSTNLPDFIANQREAKTRMYEIKDAH